jgi:hypothetical protein
MKGVALPRIIRERMARHPRSLERAAVRSDGRSQKAVEVISK